jgi:superfamily II DNA or RNA helicase
VAVLGEVEFANRGVRARAAQEAAGDGGDGLGMAVEMAPADDTDGIPAALTDVPDSEHPTSTDEASEVVDAGDADAPGDELRNALVRIDRAIYAAKASGDAGALAELRAAKRDLLADVAPDDAGAPAAVWLTPEVIAEAAVEAARDVAALDEEEEDDEDEEELEPRRAAPVALAPAGIPALQGSLAGDLLLIWAGAHGTAPAGADDLVRLITEAGGDTLRLVDHPGVRVPGGASATARSVDLPSSLGWLVAIAAGLVGHDVGPSLAWLGRMAVLACDLVARGQIVPTMETLAAGDGPAGTYVSRWLPVPGGDARRVSQMAARMPETVAVAASSRDRTVMTNTVLGAMVDAICRTGVSRVKRPAPTVVARSLPTASDAFLAGLGNGPFQADVPVARELAGRLTDWGRPALEGRGATLLVRLSAPDELGAWRLRVFVIDGAGHRLPLATARARGNPRQQRAVRAELDRLVHLVPALGRSSSAEALLGNEEAWTLMTETADLLEGAGFAVQVPAIGRSATSARLRLDASPSGAPSVVGTAQLTQVKWSAVVDDVELSAADIRRLAAQARPLIESRGQWVTLDHDTLRQLAAALAERDLHKQMTQADILRQALGLDGGLAVEVAGEGWAADVLARAAEAKAEPLPAPDGFRGDLRSYQMQARGWLQFLDTVGLGGCLALDMGLGKTPTVLAHILDTRGDGPTLVVAPAAVVGNWANEARKFTPMLRVLVHHGSTRSRADDLGGQMTGYDIVITTYNTAVRDAEALSTVAWSRLVADEAQGIKNPVSEAARALTAIPARRKLALTGTPVENGLGDLWAILNFANPGLLGPKTAFEAQLARARKDQAAEEALRKLNGVLVFRRTKSEPEIAAELPDKIDQLDACGLTPEQIGLYQAVVDGLLAAPLAQGGEGNTKVLAAITALKQICDHPEAYVATGAPLAGRSGKLGRLEELAEAVFAAGERMLVFTHFASWGERMAGHLTERFGLPVACYHGGLSRTRRDEIVRSFQSGSGAGALVVSLKAGGTGLNLTAANHVVLYDRWWNPAVEDQARDRAWRIGQTKTVISHRLVCTGTVDEQIEEVVAGKRKVADLVLPRSSTLADLGADQLRRVLGLRPDALVEPADTHEEEPAA